jgi:excisionase family DNA binding protein
MATNGSELLTLDEAATYLRVHRRTMGRLLRDGTVPGAKIGRQWRIRRVDLDRTFAAGTPHEPQTNSFAHAKINADGSSRSAS